MMISTDEIENIRRTLKKTKDDINNPIDLSLPVILPFRGNKKIKLIIIGQDPTIKNQITRKEIKCTLNMDKRGSLKKYIESILENLELTIENLYATNIYKYFYSIPPAKTPHILFNHLQPNLEVLKRELNEFPDTPIITLGEPVLQLLANEKAKVRDYWGYEKNTGKTNCKFKFSNANENKLKRDFFPFPHQPSIRKEFYKNNIKNYLKYLLNNLT